MVVRGRCTPSITSPQGSFNYCQNVRLHFQKKQTLKSKSPTENGTRGMSCNYSRSLHGGVGVGSMQREGILVYHQSQGSTGKTKPLASSGPRFNNKPDCWTQLNSQKKNLQTLHKKWIHKGEKQGPCLSVWEQGGCTQWLWLHQTGFNCEVNVRRQTNACLTPGQVRWWEREVVPGQSEPLVCSLPTCGCPSLGCPSHTDPRVWSPALRGLMRQKLDFFFFLFHLQKNPNEVGGTDQLTAANPSSTCFRDSTRDRGR